MKIGLNVLEQQLARKVAELRQYVNQSNGVKDQQQCQQSDICLQGVGAELAFCKLFNLYPDLETKLRKYPDHDCVFKGLKVDIKSSRKPNLNVKLTKQHAEVDAFALMVGEFPCYTFVGHALKATVCQPENIYDTGNGPYYTLRQEQLIQPKVA